MRTVIGSLLIFLAGAPLLRAETPQPGGATQTALAALKLLPPDKAVQLARIEARDGTPGPDRWYLIVYDNSDEKGLHEYVVAGGQIVASRGISQFAETVKPDDVLGADVVKIDSDQLAKLARDYAQANNLAIGKAGYELKKDEADGLPVWKITCEDGEGKPLAALTLSAGDGTVISHEGFAVAPPPAGAAPEVDGSAGKVTTAASPTPQEKTAAHRHKRRDTDSDNPNDETRHEGGFAGAFKHIGGKFQKFFTGHDTIDQ